MFSILRTSLVYKVNTDVADHDDDVDAEEWSYNGLPVWRGTLDVSFREHDIDVYWLYNDTSDCIGLAEHDSNDQTIFNVLLYKDSPFGTLFQEDWTRKQTLWSMLTSEAYQDYLDSSVKDIILASNGRIITPDMLVSMPEVFYCTRCNKKSFEMFECTDVKKKPFGPILNPLFMDDSYVIYEPPPDSSVWSILQLGASPSLEQCVPSVEYPEESACEAPVTQRQLQPQQSQAPDEQQPPRH